MRTMSPPLIAGLARSRSDGSIKPHFFLGSDSTTPVPKNFCSSRSPTAGAPGTRWIGAFRCVEVWKIVVILCVITPCLA